MVTIECPVGHVRVESSFAGCPYCELAKLKKVLANKEMEYIIESLETDPWLLHVPELEPLWIRLKDAITR